MAAVSRTSRRRSGPAIVLVVEDDETTREALCDTLRERHVVLSARAIEDARTLLNATKVDALVLDYMLHGTPVDTLLTELAARSSAAVILISGGRMAANLAREYGVAFLAKPVDLDSLVAAVDVAIDLEIQPTRRTRVH